MTKEEVKKEGAWEMFNLISSVWYGKKCYFREQSGIVYSRISQKYLPDMDDAVSEFLEEFGA